MSFSYGPPADKQEASKIAVQGSVPESLEHMTGR